MKIRALLAIIAALGFLLSAGCSSTGFEGSESATDAQFILEFTRLDGSRSHSLRLHPGDIVDVIIRKDSGRLDILVATSGGDTLYRADDADSGVFSLLIQKDYKYKFVVSGEGAAGKVSFNVITRAGD